MGFFSDIGDFFFGNDDAEQAHARAREADAQARSEQSRAYREAIGYIKTVPGILTEHYGPYEQAGKRSLSSLEDEYQKMLSSPQDILSSLGSKYQSSPGYQFRRDEALRGIDRAAAAGGTLGSPLHGRLAAETATNVASNDYYPYLENALRLYSSGLGGMGGLSQLGYNAASNIGDNISNSTLSLANLGYSHGSNEANQIRASQAYLDSLRPKSTFGTNGGMFNDLLGKWLNNTSDSLSPQSIFGALGAGAGGMGMGRMGAGGTNMGVAGLEGLLGNFTGYQNQSQRPNQGYNGRYWEPRY